MKHTAHPFWVGGSRQSLRPASECSLAAPPLMAESCTIGGTKLSRCDISPVQCPIPDAARYHRLQLALAAAGLALSIAYLVALLLTGAAHALARAAATATDSAWGQVAIVAVVLAGAHALLTFPLAWTRGWWLPRRYGLLHQSLRGWLADRAKAAVLAGALGLAAVEVVYALLRATPPWWLWAAPVFLAATVALAFVFPVWIVPLFYRLTPLADAELRERLLTLARRAGVPAVGVWIADQSRKSRTANAAVIGLGRTRRIVLFDTLAARFTPDEIESVLAHQLGDDGQSRGVHRRDGAARRAQPRGAAAEPIERARALLAPGARPADRARQRRPRMTRRRTLRTLVEAKQGLIVPGAYDGISAKLVQQAGFPAVYMTGYGTSASRLGRGADGPGSPRHRADGRDLGRGLRRGAPPRRGRGQGRRGRAVHRGAARRGAGRARRARLRHSAPLQLRARRPLAAPALRAAAAARLRDRAAAGGHAARGGPVDPRLPRRAEGARRRALAQGPLHALPRLQRADRRERPARPGRALQGRRALRDVGGEGRVPRAQVALAERREIRMGQDRVRRAVRPRAELLRRDGDELRGDAGQLEDAPGEAVPARLADIGQVVEVVSRPWENLPDLQREIARVTRGEHLVGDDADRLARPRQA